MGKAYFEAARCELAENSSAGSQFLSGQQMKRQAAKAKAKAEAKAKQKQKQRQKNKKKKKNKAGYTANTCCGRVGRGGNA